jgi:hypothetical protein
MGVNSNFEWCVDECCGSRFKGWIADLKTHMPAEVSFLAEGETLFRITAGGLRPDVQNAGKGVQFCGIEVAFDPTIWDRIEALDVVLADGSRLASVTKPADFDNSNSNILENYKSTFTRPIRIKAFPAPGLNGAGAMVRSLYLAPMDNTWVERMLLPESALPCFVVINDEFVTLISSESNPRADREGRRVVRSLDELTHMQLKADVDSKEENYAAFSGEFFDLTRDITVCQNVKVVNT